MTYKLRDDVVLEKICGINLLISLRTAWGESPFVLQIASVSAYIWQCMKEGMDEEQIIEGLISTRQFSEEKARHILDHFVHSAEKMHYFPSEGSAN